MAKLPKHLLKILVAFIVLAIMCHFFFKTYTTENFYALRTEESIETQGKYLLENNSVNKVEQPVTQPVAQPAKKMAQPAKKKTGGR